MKIINKDIFSAVSDIENSSVRCLITSPPYYKMRDYGDPKQIGLEKTPGEYIEVLVNVFQSLKSKIMDDGNLFINLGDKYDSNKNLMLIPSMFALRMMEEGWILRNKLIWYKPNHQPSPVKDRLTNTYEEIFHFTKNKKYYYDLDSTRIPFDQDLQHNEKVRNRFQRRIEESMHLSDDEKALAAEELNRLHSEGRINKDARLKIRNQNKVLYGGNTNLSGRAKELESRGFYFHCNNPLGKNMGDVIMVNVKSHRGSHEAVFPDELVEPLIKMGSAVEDVVLDPFAGTGTTCKVAERLGRIGLGVELNSEYIIQ